ncbi:MAG TPA: DUF2378 family protein [Minicystis sp.]|nr:DUF2378 family protein [Minicystis sp.]
MQGVVLVAIHQRLRELGDEDLRRACFPEAVLAFREYPDADLVRIARVVAERMPALAPSIAEVLRSLGEEAVATLSTTNPAIVPSVASLGDLIDVIAAGEGESRFVLPRFRVVRTEDGRAELVHTADASVCRFDEGLLIGLAARAGQRVATRHPTCRGRRDEACVFVPRVVSSELPGRRFSRTFRFEPPESGDN